jgi:uncharacterized protein
MGLIRLAIIVAVVVVALMLLKRLLAPRASSSTPPPPATPKLVQCAHCGIHVSETQAVRSGARCYCSTEHQQLDNHS